MKAISKIVTIANSREITTEYIEKALQKMNINPLRWAIVKTDESTLTISVTDLTA